MPRYQFVGGTPRSFSIVFVLAFTNFALAWCAGAFRQFWARETSGGHAFWLKDYFVSTTCVA